MTAAGLRRLEEGLEARRDALLAGKRTVGVTRKVEAIRDFLERLHKLVERGDVPLEED